MAFIKEKILSNGSSGNYWKIFNVNYDDLNKSAEIWIGLFKSKDIVREKYDEQFKPIDEKEEDNNEKIEVIKNADLLIESTRYQFGPESFPFTKDAIEGINIKAVAYRALQEKFDYFSDALND